MIGDILPFKNRAVYKEHPIEMYRCLNRKGHTFSIRQFGKVVGHTEKLTLFDCSFIVNDGGKKRCVDQKIRNVHAHIKGWFKGTVPNNLEKHKLIYSPFTDRGFHFEGLDGDLVYSQMVELTHDGIFISANNCAA